jgi:hypothetical protein
MSEIPLPEQAAMTCGPSPAVCEACGESFACGAGMNGCWCVDIKLNDAVRAELRTQYERCLCRACLEQLASASSDVMSEPGQGDSELGTAR